MNPRTRLIVIVGAVLLAGTVCVFVIPPLLGGPPILAGPTRTPTLPKPSLTPTLPKPTITPTFNSNRQVTPTPTFTSSPAVPSPFDIILDFTGGTCGTGTPSYSYTFTIDGTALTVLQTDAGITTTGSYDPSTGAFSTSGDVGPGVETYDGMISFDGTTITVSGSYSWTPDGGVTCGAEVSGTTTP
ncbi:MAG: hypothetical protein AABZ00_02585 [Chloroflexota bacterium]